MKTEDILKSEWLDILFENRNKEYGAYTIRKSYNQRLLTAVLVALGISLAAFLLLQSIKSGKRVQLFGNEQDIDLTSVAQQKPPEKLPEVKPAQQPPRKSVSYVVPVFEPDAEPQVVSPEEIPDADITGTNNPNGEPGGTTTQTPVTGPAAPDPAPVKDPEPAPVVEDAPRTYAEEMPSYPGGRDKMIAFLQQQLQDYVTEEGQLKRATVRFVIEKDGSLTGIEIVTGEDGDFNKRVIRTMQKMPRWKPGAQNGLKVKILYEFPIQLVPADEG